MDLKLLLLAVVCHLLIIWAPKWRLRPRFLQQIIIFSQKSLRWAQETVTCFKPQKQMTAAQKFKARLSSQGHGRDVSTKHKQAKNLTSPWPLPLPLVRLTLIPKQLFCFFFSR